MRTGKIKEFAGRLGKPDIWRQRAEELGLAFGLLTRFPLPAFEPRSGATMASAFWAYPIAGAAIGAAGAIVLSFSSALGFSSVPCAIFAVTTILLATGGLHEDGFSDFWDGVGGGRTREAKLEIMRDSRLGTYGALALILMLGAQISLLADIQRDAGWLSLAAVLIASEAAARGAIALPCRYLPPTRADGLGVRMKDGGGSAYIDGAIIAAIIAVLFAGVAGGFAVVIGAATGAAIVSLLAWRFLGGFTGDVLGAAAVMARLFALGAAALA